MRNLPRTLLVLTVLVSLVPLSSAASAASRCHPIVRDDRGDANEDATGLDLRLNNERTLDILTGDINYVAKSKTLVFSITVDDLTDEPPLLAEGKAFRFFFYYLWTRYEIRAWEHDVPLNTKGYTLYAGDGDQVLKNGLRGTFDTRRDRVTVTLPLSAFNSTAKPSRKLRSGGELAQIGISAVRTYFVAPDRADVAVAECDYRIGR